MQQKLWFLLTDSASYKGTTAKKVSVAPGSVIDQFRDSLKSKYEQPKYFRDIPFDALLVYKNKAAFDKRNSGEEKSPLEKDSVLDSLGTSVKEDLIVVVPPAPGVYMPPFQPSKYALEFPFFEDKDSENYIEMLERDDAIKEINDAVTTSCKYWPIIISTSRGMGKTFFLKKFGMQQIKDNLKTSIIGNAIATGRILSFDFAKNPNAIKN